MATPNIDQNSVRDYLRSIKYEAMKFYRVYDVTNRVSYQYEAPAWAANGDLCMRTEYIYDGASARVLKFKETLQTWDSTWDV